MAFVTLQPGPSEPLRRRAQGRQLVEDSVEGAALDPAETRFNARMNGRSDGPLIAYQRF